MYIENQISEIFVDFAEIFDKIKINGYSDKQKDEMMQLFEGQTIKKCLDFIYSSIKFVKGIANISDLVLNVIQKKMMSDFKTKESFLQIFDKAVNLYDETSRVENMNDPYNGDMEHAIDEVKELKKKNDDLRSENDVFREEIEDKSSNLAEIENLYIKLKYDYYKINDQWETINEENVILKNKISALCFKKDLGEERKKEEILGLVELIKNLERCVTERDAQINELVEDQKRFSESIEILKTEVKIKSCLLEEINNKSEDFQIVTDTDVKQKQAVGPEECNVCSKCLATNQNLRTHIGNDHGGQNIIHKLVSDKKDLSQNSLAVLSFDLETNDTDFRGEEIKYCSTRKSLSEELLGAWTALSDDDDALLIEHDDPIDQCYDFFKSPDEIKKSNTMSFFEDSGFHQVDTNYYSCQVTSSNEPTENSEESKYDSSTDGNDDEEHSKEEKFVRSDIHTKLKEIREQLSVLEKNLSERKRKVNRSLCSTLLSIFYNCFEIFS